MNPNSKIFVKINYLIGKLRSLKTVLIGLLNLLLSIYLISLLLFFVYVLFGTHLIPYHTDYSAFATAGRLVVEEDRDDFYDLLHQRDFQQQLMGEYDYGALRPFVYTPLTALMFIPFNNFSLATGYKIYFLLNILLLILVGTVFVKYQKQIQVRRLYIFLPFLFTPNIVALVSGQLGIIILLVYTLIYISFRKENILLAAVFSGLLILKPQFLICLPFLILLSDKKKKFMFYLGLIFIVWLLAFVFILGIEQFINYPNAVASAEVPAFNNISNHYISIFNLIGRISPDWFAYFVLGTFYLFFLLFFKIRVNKISFDISFSIILFISILFSPHAFIYDATVFTLYILILLKKIKRSEGLDKKHFTRDLVLMLLFFLLITLFNSNLISFLIIFFYTLYLLIFELGYDFSKLKLEKLDILVGKHGRAG